VEDCTPVHNQAFRPAPGHTYPDDNQIWAHVSQEMKRGDQFTGSQLDQYLGISKMPCIWLLIKLLTSAAR
jgi:hypothetical protein